MCFDFPVGEPVDPAQLLSIPEGHALRLLKVDRSLWESTLEHSFELDLTTSSLVNESSENHRYFSLVEEQISIESAPSPGVASSAETSDSVVKSDN